MLLFADATKPTTTVNVTYKVGSRHENYGETGMAHLLEHMLFKGTPSIAERVRRARPARHAASTARRRTTARHYFETFTASRRQPRLGADDGSRADDALDVHARTELDSEMTVVRNEYRERREQSAAACCGSGWRPSAFDWHNYGKPTIGARSDIENVPFERLRAFYTHVLPARQRGADRSPASSIADATLAAIAKYFGADSEADAHAAEALHGRAGAGRRAHRDRAPRRRARSGSARCSTLPQGAHPDASPFEALGEVMTVEPAGRLYKALVEGKKASRVENWMFAAARCGLRDFLGAGAASANRSTPRATRCSRRSYDVAAHPITDGRARPRAHARRRRTSTTRSTIRSRWRSRSPSRSREGDWRLFFIHRDRWRTLTPADVTRVAADYLKPSNLTVGMFLPEAKPDRAPLAAAVDMPALVKDYKGDPPVAAGEAFDPTPANLEARTERCSCRTA